MLPEYYFQLGYTPFIATRAIFEANKEYQTFDIHFDISYLQKIGLDYKKLDIFMSKVTNGQPAELSNKQHACSPIMADCINTILNNRYSSAGRRHLLDNAVQLILTAALEIVGAQEIGRQDIPAADREALQNAYDLILKNCPHQLSNADIVSD